MAYYTIEDRGATDTFRTETLTLTLALTRGGSRGFAWGGATWQAQERKPITGVWGRAPSGVQDQSPWSGSQGGEAP